VSLTDYIDYIGSAGDEVDDPAGYLADIAQIISLGITSANPAIRVKYMWLKEKFAAGLRRQLKAHRDSSDRGYYRGTLEALQSLPNFA